MSKQKPSYHDLENQISTLKLENTILKNFQREGLKESEIKLFENLHIGIVVHAPDTSILLCNPEAANLLGLSPSQLEGKTAMDSNWYFLDQSGKKLSMDEYPVMKVIKSNTSVKNQIYGINRPFSDERVWVEVNAYPEFDKNLKLERVVVSFMDITKLKRSEENLLQRTAFFEALLNTTIEGILIIDSNGNKVFQNKRNIEIFSIPLEYAYNVDDRYQLEYVISVNKNPEQFAQKVKYLYDHPEESNQDEIELKNGKILDRFSAPVIGSDGFNYGRIWLFRDITQQKLAEKDLIKAKEDAIESDRLKTAFLQNVSHEIRTPMNAIVGFSELLIRNFNNKAKLESFVSIIKKRSAELLVIIDDILDIAKIESGQMSVQKNEFNISGLFDELKFIFTKQQVRCGKQHIGYKTNLVGILSQATIMGDRNRLIQIFTNLIHNALKYTETGKIEVGCRLNEYQQVVFYVSDTGIGIAAEKHEQIFERFVQLNNQTSHFSGGNGLGLSIVKGLVNLLGGNIWLNSEPGKGTTFYFTINSEIYPPK